MKQYPNHNMKPVTIVIALLMTLAAALLSSCGSETQESSLTPTHEADSRVEILTDAEGSSFEVIVIDPESDVFETIDESLFADISTESSGQEESSSERQETETETTESENRSSSEEETAITDDTTSSDTPGQPSDIKEFLEMDVDAQAEFILSFPDMKDFTVWYWAAVEDWKAQNNQSNKITIKSGAVIDLDTYFNQN